jgi:hypothetical protein
MRHTITLNTVALCFLGWSFALATDSFGGQGADTSYLPLCVGNQWTLMTQGQQITERIVDTVRKKGELYFRFDTLEYQPDVLLRESGARVYRYQDTSEVLWYDFSADSGANWTIPMQGQMTVEGINDRVVVPAGDFSGCRRYYWFLGMDAATTEWFARGIGLVKREIITIAGPKLWSLQSAVITSVESGMDNGTVSAFRLEQNYPNPFNPKTGIRYQVPGVSNVKLAVYDLLGREVAVLVNERKAAGAYEVKFNGGGLASGVYIYRLTTDSFVRSRTMILIK